MDLREAFLRDIAEHPDDNTPRRVFADWLLDQDSTEDAELGRFILLHCDRDNSDEEGTLLVRLAARWQERLAPLAIREWQRGFVTTIGLPMLPVVPAEAYQRLASWPDFLVVRRLETFYPGEPGYHSVVPPDLVQELLGSPYWHVTDLALRGVTYLNYAEELYPAIDAEGLRRLCVSPAARTLRQLDLSTNFYPQALEYHFDRICSSQLRNLKTLVLDYDAYGREACVSDGLMRRFSVGLNCRVVADGRSVEAPRS
jgi:uncharacterized protein (TIGR02996 family)